MDWFLSLLEQGWPLALFGLIWFWFVPELIADKVMNSSVHRILHGSGGKGQPVRTFLPLVLPIIAYAIGIGAIVWGGWIYFR